MSAMLVVATVFAYLAVATATARHLYHGLDPACDASDNAAYAAMLGALWPIAGIGAIFSGIRVRAAGLHPAVPAFARCREHPTRGVAS